MHLLKNNYDSKKDSQEFLKQKETSNKLIDENRNEILSGKVNYDGLTYHFKDANIL